MFPSYGASPLSSTATVFNALGKGSISPPPSKSDGKNMKGEMTLPQKNTGSDQALPKPKDRRGLTLPISPINSNSVTPQGTVSCDSEDADMVYVSSPKHNDPNVIRNTSEVLFTDSDIQDILKPGRASLANGRKDNSSSSSLVNGTSSPTRINKPSRESTGSLCSEGNLELSKSRSSSCLSPLPKLLESLSPAERASMTRPQIISQEILVTERIYVRDLQEVIEGYLIHLLHHGMTDKDIETIFGNLEDIYDFNRGILEELENIEQQRDPVRISQCFLNKAQGFNSLYVQYCTNYPESAAFLTEILKDKEVSDFFAERQRASGHTLPIDSYLMKPVQRIMKYHLLFKDLAKHFGEDETGYEVIRAAAASMTDVAEYINEMKRLHENALRVQEILGSIEDLEKGEILNMFESCNGFVVSDELWDAILGLDVFTTGRLVLENSFRVHGSRGDKQLYLFEKLLLICKKLDEGIFQFRDGLSCSNMMLVESIPKEPLCFQLIRFDNQKISYTIQAKVPEVKREWTMQLKRLILETHTSNIPTTAREAILGRSTNMRESKFKNSINLQALDDTKIHWRRSKPLAQQAGKENHNKDRGSLLVGVKRESVLKEDSTNIPKKSSLNTKAKEFIDKQAKEKIEKVKTWKLKRNKPRKGSASNSFEVEVPERKAMSPLSEYKPPSTMVKSRSLESLRDAISSSQEDLLSSGDTPASVEDEKSQDASEQLRRLSMLHDLVSSDVQEMARNSDPTNENEETEPPVTPRNLKELRRKHASKSVYLEMPDDPIKPGDLKRSRPLSLPPGTAVNDMNGMPRIFGTDLENLERSRNDLRKYGLTRTRSLNRKIRTGSGIPSGSTSSVCGTKDTEKDKATIEDTESDKFEMLEQRLSIISDDESSSSAIKNTLRQVSQAFSSYGSDKALNTIRAPSASTTSLTADFDALLAQDDIWRCNTLPRSKRRSLGSIISETINPDMYTSLDSAKKKAFSTSVINEVSLDVADDELDPKLRNEVIAGTENDTFEGDEESSQSVRDRINSYVAKVKSEHSAENSDLSLGRRQRRSSDVSEMSLDSHISGDGIDFNPPKRDSQMEIVAPNTNTESNHSDMSNATDESTNAVFERVINDGNTLQMRSQSESRKREDVTDSLAPQRPNAPSLNYVRSLTFSIRQYRKRNVEVKDSKSVYERIREYTALVSKEKKEIEEKSVDEMLESLDSATELTSDKYIDNRRKLTRMVSVADEPEPTNSVLSDPQIWFDTDSRDGMQLHRSSKVISRSRGNSKIETNNTKSELKANGKLEKSSGDKNKNEVRSFPGISSILNSWKKKEASTLPRHKSDNKPVSKKNSHNNNNNNNHNLKGQGPAKESWKKSKSMTVDVTENSNRETRTAPPRKTSSQQLPEIEVTLNVEDQERTNSVVVKDRVKEYYHKVIVPGEKEVEEMRESNMRRSKKKKDREKMKSNLHRKLSLRNLEVEDEEKERNKLNRSASCENVQRGTVRNLISLFNVTKS